MPKSKSRGRRFIAHHSGRRELSVSERKARYGSGERPSNGRSTYMGSVITAKNRNQYEAESAKAFRAKYLADQGAKYNKIKEQEDKSEDQIEAELEEFHNSQITDEELDALCKDFARFQTNKEQKHYKSWLRGESVFSYKGQTFPVLAERFMKESRSIQDIIKEKEDGDNKQSGEGGDIAPVSGTGDEGGDQTLRSDTSSEEG